MSSSALINVKSTQAFTLEFLGGTASPCYSKGLLESSPAIYFTGNSMFFDYSQSKISGDLRFLKLFFDGLNVGNTLNFSSGTYVNIDTGASTSWNGQLTLQGKTGTFNQFLYFSGVSGISSLTQSNYDPNLFTNPIQFSATSGATANLLLFKNPGLDPLNFNYLGLYGSDLNIEEYIQVDTSTLNQYRIPVKTSIKLNDGSEAIYLSPSSTIVNENLFFQKSLVSVYLRGSLTPDQINFDETINGVMRITADSPGQFSLTLDNQNFQQSILTKYSNPPTTVYYYWYPNLSLGSFTTNNVLPYTTESYSFTRIYHLVYNTVVETVFVSSALNEVPIIATTETYNNILIDGSQTQTLLFSVSTVSDPKNFKIDLSDARNLGTDIDVYLDPACSIPLENNSRLIGVPGRDGAAFIYYADRADTIQSIYLQLTRENTKVLEIIID
jgi:hypothetical protein